LDLGNEACFAGITGQGCGIVMVWRIVALMSGRFRAALGSAGNSFARVLRGAGIVVGTQPLVRVRAA